MPQATPPRPARVLVIEDDARLRDLYVEILTRARYEVQAVPTVGLAIEALLSEPADVIIASPHDVVPADLLAALHGIAPRLPVIMCSGIVDDELRRLATDFGVAAVLEKPVDMRRLVEAVRQAAGRTAA
jgi:two-component system phosphate regulon response regulator OmpR